MSSLLSSLRRAPTAPSPEDAVAASARQAEASPSGAFACPGRLAHFFEEIPWGPRLESAAGKSEGEAMTHHQMLIGGAWVDAVSGASRELRDPASGDVVATVPEAGREDAARAIH